MSLPAPPGADHAALVDLMRRDKKALRGLTFALDGPTGVAVVDGVSTDDVLATLQEIA